MRAPPARGVLVGTLAVVVLVAVAILGPCRGGGGGGGSHDGSTTTPPGSSGSLKDQAKKVTASVLGGGGSQPALGSAQGSVRTFDGPQAAIAEVLSVETGPAAVLLRWRIKSTGPTLRLLAETFRESPGTDTADVVLVDPAAQKLAKPSRFRDKFGVRCACSTVPVEVDAKGQVLTGLYPPLSEATQQVEVRIPGFPPITNVVVTRS